MPSSNAGALSVRPRLAGSAAGLAGALTVGGGAVLTSITGAIVTEETGVYALLGMMLFCALMGLPPRSMCAGSTSAKGSSA